MRLAPRAFEKALAVLLVICSISSPAGAREDWVRLSGEGGWACYADDDRHHGIYAGAEAAYVFGGFWGLRGGYAVGDHATFRVERISLGVQYLLDVFEYVPWVAVSPALFTTSGEPGGPAAYELAVTTGFGFDWLMNPSWSIGFAGEYHQLLAQPRFPAYVNLGLRLGYRWTIGDPFEP